MFVGHYAPSLALRRTGGVPLWALFLAVQFVDILWASLVMSGVEKVRLTEGFTAASPLDLYYMPYTPSIAMLRMQYSNTLMPLPESTTQFAMMALTSYFGLAAAAWFVERKWGERPNTGQRWDTLHPGGG